MTVYSSPLCYLNDRHQELCESFGGLTSEGDCNVHQCPGTAVKRTTTFLPMCESVEKFLYRTK